MYYLLKLTTFILYLSIVYLKSAGAMENCEAIIQHFETRHGIPAGLLKAISRIESGRYFPGQGVISWPWTINANGNAYYLNSKREAIAKAKQLQSQGITSMDVGPMQINLKHHPDAFNDLEEAFDPWKNIAYAAQFLVQKKNAQGNWQEAVAHYHSATATFNVPYRDKVMESWAKNRGLSPTQTVFNMNAPQSPSLRPTARSTLYSGIGDRRVPVKVKFGRKTRDGHIRSHPASLSATGNRPENPHSIMHRPSDSMASPSLVSRVVSPRGIPLNQSTLQKTGGRGSVSRSPGKSSGVLKKPTMLSPRGKRLW